MSKTEAVLNVELPGVNPPTRGKVRDIFDLGDQLLIVTTDRVSAFDVILPNGIPSKGKVLTRLSQLWFERLASIVPHHCISTDPAEYPDVLKPHADLLRGRSMLCRKAEVIPFECVVRGYLAGSGYKDYLDTGAVCGIPLGEGLRMSERLPRPIFTPATKAETGHDENVSFEVMADAIGKERTEELSRISLALYNAGASYALEKGIVIADTKFEFGLIDDEIILIDEALTPDSSRFWRAGEIQHGVSPASLDKQFIRDFLETTDWNKLPPGPDLPAEIVEGTAARYQEILSILS